jgi:predicted TIM-barrel fold metal-dependent hydrolase
MTALPQGSTDTHLHVFEPTRFGYSQPRSYTPGEATLGQAQAAHQALGVQRRVFVQPSVYGTDNRCTLDAVQRAGHRHSRAIVVLDLDHVTSPALDALDRAGARGVRLNLAVRDEGDARRACALFLQAARTITLSGWCVQIHCSHALLPVLEDTLPAFAVPVVLDHFGGLRAPQAHHGDPARDTLTRLLATGKVYVKLSAGYRASDQAEPHADLAPLAQHLIACRPDRLLWGSDWPHTGGGQRDPTVIEAFRRVDLALALDSLRQWCGSPGPLRHILVDNPARLYGFDAPAPQPPQEPSHE